MSIFDTLVESGVTQEDLEKAASARLFAEAAAAEGIDLSELSEDQAEELYDFWANGGEYAEKSASAEEMLAEAAVKEAGAKLAEAEYIGRYMARVYSDEMNKLAEEGAKSTLRGTLKARGMAGAVGAGAKEDAKAMYESAKGTAQTGYDNALKHLSRKSLSAKGKALSGMVGASDLSEGYKAHKAARKAKDLAGQHAALKQLGKGGLRAGLTAGAVGGTGYLAHKAMSHKKESAFDTVVEQRAMEILEALQEPSFDEAIDEAAIDLLRANGYDV